MGFGLKICCLFLIFIWIEFFVVFVHAFAIFKQLLWARAFCGALLYIDGIKVGIECLNIIELGDGSKVGDLIFVQS